MRASQSVLALLIDQALCCYSLRLRWKAAPCSERLPTAEFQAALR